MHDVHVAKALVDHLTRELGAAGLASVATVRVRVDAALAAESLTLAYEVVTQGTGLEGSELEVDQRGEERTCAACGSTWSATAEDVHGHVLVCPSCGAPSTLGAAPRVELIEVITGRCG